MNYSTISVTNSGPAGIVTLNRPAKYNAVTREMMGEIMTAVSALEEDDSVSAVIITGSDEFFSTGADLNEAVTVKEPLEIMLYNRAWRGLSYRIEHLFKPVIGAISGYCLTGGLELAMTFDVRIAAENAKFGITSSKIGSVAGAGGTQRLPRLVGPAVAKELLFTADFIDASRALQVGLVNAVVPVGAAVEAAEAMAQTCSARGPLALAWLKVAVNSGMNMDMESALDFEAALSAEAFMTADKEEGMRAFLEKRDAIFQGR